MSFAWVSKQAVQQIYIMMYKVWAQMIDTNSPNISQQKPAKPYHPIYVEKLVSGG